MTPINWFSVAGNKRRQKCSELKVDGNDIPIFPIAIPLSLSLPIDIYYDSDFWFTLGHKWRLGLRRLIIGSLSNDDADGNENGKKGIGLISKTTTLHVHHAFLYISLPSLPDYNVKVPEFTFCRGREHKTTTFFSFPQLWYSPLEFNSKSICQQLTK